MESHDLMTLPREMRGGLWRRADPFFSALVVGSLLLHAGVALALSSVPPPPPLSVDDIPDPMGHWIKRTPLFHVPQRPPVTAKPRPVDIRPGAGVPKVAAAPGALKRIQLNVLRSLGHDSPMGQVFSGEGPASVLATDLRGAAGVDVDVERVSLEPRGAPSRGDPVDIRTPGVPGGDARPVVMAPRRHVEVKASVEEDGTPEIEGEMNPREVVKTIHSRMAGFRGCYENAMKRTAKLHGKVSLEFTIAEDGRVSEASVDVDTVGDPEMSRCLVGLIKRIHFPPPEKGSVRASFPFVFVPVE